MKRKTVIPLVTWALGISFVLAQVNTGQINGTVKDPSQAVVPNALVTVVNTDTGLTRSTRSGTAVTSSYSSYHRAPMISVWKPPDLLLFSKRGLSCRWANNCLST